MATTGSTTSAAVNNIYSSIAAKNKGLGGLISGLDTESLVEALTSGTRGRISTQQQAKTKLQWKQTAYRSVITNLGAFRTTYLSNEDPTKNMKRNAWYTAYKATTSSSAVTVKTDNCSNPGTIEIEQIKSLASSKTIKSELFTRDLKGNTVDWSTTSFAGQTLTIRLDSKAASTYNIRLDSLDALNKSSATYELDLETALNNILEDALGQYTYYDDVTSTYVTENIVSADISGGVVTLTAKSNRMEVMANCPSLGLTADMSNRISTTSTLADFFGSSLVGTGANGDRFTFNINGVDITVKADETISSVMNKINNAGANVRISFDTAEEVFIIAATNSGAGDTVQLRDIQGNLLNQLFGTQGTSTLKSEADDNVSLVYQSEIFNNANMNLADLKTLVSSLKQTGGSPGTFTIRVNGKTYNVSVSVDDQFFTDVGTTLTNSHESACITYLKNALYDLDPNYAASLPPSPTLADYEAALNDPAYATEYAAYTTWKSEKYDELEGSLYENALYTAMNEGIKNAMGVFYDQTIGFAIKQDNSTPPPTFQLAFLSTNPNTFLELGSESFLTSTGSSGLNFTGGADNYDPTLYDPSVIKELSGLGVTGTGTLNVTMTWPDSTTSTLTLAYTPTTTLHDLMQLYNAQINGGTATGIIFSIENGVITLSGGDNIVTITDSASSGGILDTVFDVSSGSFTTTNKDATFDEYDAATNPSGRITSGTNAVIVINNKTIPSTNNTFNYNGIVFEVSELFNEAGPVAGDTITISVNTDHEGLANKIQGFIDDYNALVTTLYTLYNEEVKSDYAPLTEEQKAEMTEEQIEKWENEAKKGILRNDAHLRTILDQMRRVFYQEVEAVGLAPYQIGITTQSVYNTSTKSIDNTKHGLLELDRDMLVAALETNGDQVRQMFTTTDYVEDAQGNRSPIGVAHQLEAIIWDAVNPTVVEESRGSLVWVAGSENLADDDSIIGKRIKYIDQRISNLKVRLENEYNRYWKKFTALETAISRMAAQSSWLTENT